LLKINLFKRLKTNISYCTIFHILELSNKTRMDLATGINFDYIRVSTNEQNLDRQLEEKKSYVTNEKSPII